MSAEIVEFAAVKQVTEDKSSLIIDVRNPDEFAAGHIPSAVNVPLPELGEAVALSPEQFKEKYKFDQPGKDDAIITNCKLGGRAGKGFDLLKGAGFTNMKLYKGSFTDWVEKGGEVVKSE